MFHRICKPLKSNSFFLFGARGTGKTTLLETLFHKQKCLRFDFLRPEIEQEFSTRPERFRELVVSQYKDYDWIVLDEIQRLPKLLNIVHELIESKKVLFALTGSSARKLRRGAANLLAGRAFVNYLFPLTHLELEEKFVLSEVLAWGALPKIFHLSEVEGKQEYLRSYVATYVSEEIKAEQLVRNLDPFRRFLEVAAQAHAKLVNYSNIANDVGVDTKTVQTYYQILEDTYMGYFLEPFHTSIRKSVGRTPKFYFFDLGVQRALARQLTMTPSPGTGVYGELFESFVILECLRLNEYLKKDFRFSFLRTKDDLEIDLIIDRPGKKRAVIEIKSTNKIAPQKLNRFRSLAADIPNATMYCFSQDPIAATLDSIHCLPWQEGIQAIF